MKNVKNVIKINILFYFKRIFSIAVAIAFGTFLIFMLARHYKFDLNLYLNWLFIDSFVVFFGCLIFSPIFTTQGIFKTTYNYPTSDMLEEEMESANKNMSVSFILGMIGLTLLGLLGLIYFIFHLI
jgi:hypothetical protein